MSRRLMAAKRRGQRLSNGRVHFEGLRPLGDGIAAVCAAIPKVSGSTDERHSLSSASLEDRLAKQQAKLARRAARAGYPSPATE